MRVAGGRTIFNCQRSEVGLEMALPFLSSTYSGSGVYQKVAFTAEAIEKPQNRSFFYFALHVTS